MLFIATKAFNTKNQFNFVVVISKHKIEFLK